MNVGACTRPISVAFRQLVDTVKAPFAGRGYPGPGADIEADLARLRRETMMAAVERLAIAGIAEAGSGRRVGR